MTKHSQASREDVLNAFAMDYVPGSSFLARYLSDYPQFATDLVDLSRELSREISDEPLSADELAYLHGKMGHLRETEISLAKLQSVPAKVFTAAADALELPLQVGLAFRERRIDVATLPDHLLERLAQALQAPLATLQSFLAMPPQVSTLRASKSNEKPGPAVKVSLDKVLRDAGVDEKRITALLRGDE
jgi:hypothetical protein